MKRVYLLLATDKDGYDRPVFVAETIDIFNLKLEDWSREKDPDYWRSFSCEEISYYEDYDGV